MFLSQNLAGSPPSRGQDAAVNFSDSLLSSSSLAPQSSPKSTSRRSSLHTHTQLSRIHPRPTCCSPSPLLCPRTGHWHLSCGSRPQSTASCSVNKVSRSFTSSASLYLGRNLILTQTWPSPHSQHSRHSALLLAHNTSSFNHPLPAAPHVRDAHSPIPCKMPSSYHSGLHISGPSSEGLCPTSCHPSRTLTSFIFFIACIPEIIYLLLVYCLLS